MPETRHMPNLAKWNPAQNCSDLVRVPRALAGGDAVEQLQQALRDLALPVRSQRDMGQPWVEAEQRLRACGGSRGAGRAF